MNLSRRSFLISGISTAICAGITPTFLPELLPEVRIGHVLGQALKEDWSEVIEGHIIRNGFGWVPSGFALQHIITQEGKRR